MNLHAVFGKRYTISIDPSWCAYCVERRAEFQPEQIPCEYHEIRGKCGWVYPYSETQLAVVLPTRAARRLFKLMGPELTLLQHADLEMCYKADAKHAEALVRFIKPKSLRRLTPKHKATLAARLARYRFQRPKTTQANHNLRTDSTSVSAGVVP
jgi:hypothetical protein